MKSLDDQDSESWEGGMLSNSPPAAGRGYGERAALVSSRLGDNHALLQHLQAGRVVDAQSGGDQALGKS